MISSHKDVVAMTTEYTHMLVSLFGVLALLLACVFALRKFKQASNVGNKQIKILNAVSIGAKEKMLLVEVNKTVLLIGATPSHIETLYVFNELEAGIAPEKLFSDQISSITEKDTNKSIA
jgi:flagellar protein FliO/FliZ